MTEVMAIWIQLHWIIWVLVPLALDHLALAQDPKPTRWPLYPQKPVVLVWNAPTEDCRPRHNIHLQLDQFQIVASPNQDFTKQNLTMFYKDRLGLYPHFQDGVPVNGGLPQMASLTHHREKMPEGIAKYIRDPSARGLAVIDWEEWRPIWIRNWDAKNIYKIQSQLLVTQKNPGWTQNQIKKVAQQEFEMSSRAFMLKTLMLAKSLRPNQLWGFYLFPDCYNHDYRRSLENYTGRCPDVEVARNDQLKWLWTESTALFPSIYMKSVLRSSSSGRQFVRNRVKEAMRLASVGEGLARPVFVYSRPTYDDELELLTEMDLVSTVGESVALGAAGIIFWGNAAYASSNATCSSLNQYLRGPLGRYLLNVSTAAEQCSRFLCSSHGRCLRRQPNTDTYLHLDSQTHTIVGEGSELRVKGDASEEEQRRMSGDFQCQCFSGFQGERCDLEDPLQQRGDGHALKALWIYLLTPLLLHLLT
ncbi:hyaluronidase-2 [Carassius gibelio]|uniref:hyaluronidase-2 n=1 Tax=Carassius gibelio TaxID=101364 RepID=UPI002278B54F|nr:hyaluronidase-2 [Carassius gibelio]XP_052413961.1 hyaluronidase-2 [Carassius gibelio]XP_052413962.1 hyaluronidase-2 [Carassius gibelio]XP_052413963.1 hyaluronidase-2 [Carassius gibelio]